jgi:carbamoyl-phosphate synthase large subunit
VGAYEIYGCDVSSTAYGLYETGFTKSYHIAYDGYVSNVIDACLDAGASFLIPGGEGPMTLLSSATQKLTTAGIQLLSNAPEMVSLFADKEATFKRLEGIGVTIPRTCAVTSEVDVNFVGLPCIVKPATGSGGSTAVFFAVSTDEAMLYAEFIRKTGATPVAQEYIDESEGEFTIGVLSLPDQHITGSVALRRALDAKLSVAYRGRGGLISSGYSQGYIDEFPDLCRQAERIAMAVGSRGPINVQGRVIGGVLLPFEINPRFSASTFLRALAGFNEIDTLIQYHVCGEVPGRPAIRAGWYLRSLNEKFVSNEQIK